MLSSNPSNSLKASATYSFKGSFPSNLRTTTASFRFSRNWRCSLHALSIVRGVRPLDSDLTDPDWYPGSAARLYGASLGGFADCHREVMEEYVPIRARIHESSPSDDDDYAELLASLGTLRAKAKDAAGAAEMFLRAATERDRRRDARGGRATELKEAERCYEEALTRRRRRLRARPSSHSRRPRDCTAPSFPRGPRARRHSRHCTRWRS